MKKLIGAALLIAGTMQAAYAFNLDTLIGSAALGNSGDATETAALAAALGVAANTLTLDIRNNAPAALANPGAPGQWYLDVAPREPGFFVLKFGTGGTGVSNDTYFFENVDEMTKLVWSNAQVNFLTGGDCGARNQNACNIGRLSHYTLFDGGGGGNEVPEPGTLVLFGLALAGLGAMRRRSS